MSNGMTNASQKTEYTAGDGISISGNTISAPYAPTTAGEKGQVWTSNGDGGGKWADNEDFTASSVFPIFYNRDGYSYVNLGSLNSDQRSVVDSDDAGPYHSINGTKNNNQMLGLFINTPECNITSQRCYVYSFSESIFSLSSYKIIESYSVSRANIDTLINSLKSSIGWYGVKCKIVFDVVISIGSPTNVYAVRYNTDPCYITGQVTYHIYPGGSVKYISDTLQEGIIYFKSQNSDENKFLFLAPTQVSIFN